MELTPDLIHHHAARDRQRERRARSLRTFALRRPAVRRAGREHCPLAALANWFATRLRSAAGAAA